MDEGPWALQRALQPLVLPWTEVKGFLGCSEASGFACISLSLFLPPSLYFLFLSFLLTDHTHIVTFFLFPSKAGHKVHEGRDHSVCSARSYTRL